MLVIAPLRVCRRQWRQEAAKWEEFRHLKFSFLHGKDKDARLEDDADIWLINPEGVEWLCQKYFGRQLPFDIVCIDELTRFKNSQSNRSKALKPRIERVPYKWGLTGSLASNGYMDLFGCMLVIDNGAALGRYITHYRDSYFSLDFDGFTYNLQPGAEKRIVAKLAPYTFPMDEADYAQLPQLYDIPHFIDMEPAQRKIYDRMKKDLIATLPEGVVTAANTAACYSKLSQMANGAVYVSDDKSRVSTIHDAKIDELEDLLEELNGEPLLVAYEFNHDFDRLRERFGVVDEATGKKVLPYLGKGTTAKQEQQWIEAWNRGELKWLFAHPASAGHGLNMQEFSAFNVAWFGITWDWELYDQFIRRIWRDGTKAKQVFNHLFLVRDTIDELKYAALGDKQMTQSGLTRALNAEIHRSGDAATPPASEGIRRNEPVTMKLTRPGTAPAPATPQAETTAPAAPAKKGWGKPASAAAPAQMDIETAAQEAAQRENIQANLQGQGEQVDRASDARSAFSGKVADLRSQINAEHGGGAKEPAAEPKADKPTGGRARTKIADETSVSTAPASVTNVDARHTVNVSDSNHGLLVKARVDILKLAAAQEPQSTDELFQMAEELWAWASDGDTLKAALAPF